MIRDQSDILKDLQQAVKGLVERGAFENGWKFKPSQKAALEKYDFFLNRDDLSTEDKLTGFFEIPTGVGKTAVFGAIIADVHKIASAKKQDFKTMIVVPTNFLVDQTLEDINEVTPSIGSKIGLYDGTRKQLDKPVTIITYNSWTTLLEDGSLSAENTDLLISDEAHRGTSERRVENVFEAYDEQEGHTTARLAFTATSRFDAEKSVEKSHKNKIFERPLKESVRDGELAEYVSTQLYVIRVEPDEKFLTGEFSASSMHTDRRQAMRKEGWNKRMLAILKEGTDKVTGDPLLDNQSAFFVSSTAHADRVEKMLNADPILQKIAKERGMDNVAVAVHSKIPKGFNKQRMDGYKAGKYLVAVGDSQFKEGFDHPPMKNVFDYPRSSLVDKGQILGRGARRWHNEAKQRYEGMTFIDTIVYVGSDDPEEDKLIYEAALENAILATDVLESTFALREGSRLKPPQDDKKKKKGGSGGVFSGDPNVTEYSTLERLHLIHAERDRLIEENDFKVKLSDIKEAIEGYRAANNGKSPSGRTKGFVEHGPFAGKVGWVAVISWFIRDAFGLSDDPEYKKWSEELKAQEKTPSFAQYLKDLGYSNRENEGVLHAITMANIKEAVEQYRAANNGKNPTTRSGKIEHKSFGKITWNGLRSALMHGGGGLSEDPEWNNWVEALQKKEITPSLAEFLVKYDFKDRSHHAAQRTPLTMEYIRKAVEGYREAHNGARPNGRQKEMVEAGTLKEQYTWVAINAALMSGNNGLEDDSVWKKWSEEKQAQDVRPSLSQFVKDLDL